MVDFLVIGNVVAAHYDEVFPLMMKERIFLGYSISSGDRKFRVPDDYEFSGHKYSMEEGERFIWVKGVRWFSNISDCKRGNFEFKRDYVEGYFKRFDECPDCINIDRKDDIPDGYYGMMGIPVSAVMYINRDQFDILGVVHRGVQKYDLWTPYVEGEFKFSRWIIKRK